LGGLTRLRYVYRRDIVKSCVSGRGASLNLGFTAWSPLARGMLTGKYHGHGSPEQGRRKSDEEYSHDFPRILKRHALFQADTMRPGEA
jgi:aryl-alcohol dehydrogenase-like predicted oxidoreductase